MNLPNKLTVLRILLVIPFMLFLKLEMNLIALIIFAIASFTDFLDGYIARKNNLISDFGKLMDPLADKILTVAAMFLFVELHYIASWMAIIIVSREFLVTGLRIIAAAKGEVIPADKTGKIKTVSQMIALIAILFTKESVYSELIMLVPTVLTVWSGYSYVKKCKHYFV